MIEFFIATNKESLSTVMSKFFELHDGSIIRNVLADYGEIHITAYGTWETYKNIASLAGNHVYSLEHFEEDAQDKISSSYWTSTSTYGNITFK